MGADTTVTQTAELDWGVAAVGARFCTRAYFAHMSDATKAMQLADAAPDLLAALKRVTYFASFTDDLRITARVIGGTTEAAENYIKRADEQDNAVKAAKAIIAKAEGGASRGGATAS